MAWRSITVRAHEQVVGYRDGELLGVLGPGRHPRERRTTYSHVDVREQVSVVGGQELLTADGVTVKLSAAIRWQVGDPVRYEGVAVEPQAQVYLAAQLALREQLTGLTADELVRTGREVVGQVATEAAQTAGARLGITVLDVVIKDVVLPAEVRLAYTEVITARQRGQAQLETARAETAALRSLANGAKLLEDHPALARLRAIQSAPPGTQLVIKLE